MSTIEVDPAIFLSGSLALGAMIQADPELTPGTILELGEGQQGVIFRRDAQPKIAIKLEKSGNETKPKSLRHEYAMHQNVEAAFKKHREVFSNSKKAKVYVPSVSTLVSPRTEETEFPQVWKSIDENFPQYLDARGNIVFMDLIDPLPKDVRRALVAYYNPPDSEEVRDAILHTPSNMHCLIRPYLGRETGPLFQPGPAGPVFTMRNFPLYLSSILDLQLDTITFAIAIGRAFAIMHWGAGMDGVGVEFALGSALKPAHYWNQHQREVRLYLFDFGECQEIDLIREDMTPEVVYEFFKEAMVRGDNRFYIPHYSRWPELFGVFKKAYMEAGQKILREGGLSGIFDVERFLEEYEQYAKHMGF
ncbi:uncharacterized protein BCR38DRAFT_447447 [Pseudomassariella vexata]|uniref:DUF3669 domain-containing protein n=1 Tax=Pseudomassariella vexata TaxID=1141098 RepID=A0A1Y2DH78_9PEZI|nr:uncharacterized protein BCR38DRAFT_447447 [Pseudomassariella vexata]ORY58486.1 hypothetical protein BCR38DRAFT_447447 [Pseudomassariella vexata]